MELKLDADDQAALAEAEIEAIRASIAKGNEALDDLMLNRKAPGGIASKIAAEFFPVASLFHADLRRLIMSAIEAERGL